MLFFNGVVRGQVGTELQSQGKELFQGEIGGTTVIEAGGVECGPGLSEMVMLIRLLGYFLFGV